MKKSNSKVRSLLFITLFPVTVLACSDHDNEFSLESDNTQTISFCAAASLQLSGKSHDTNVFYSALKAITDNAHATEKQAGIVEGIGLGQAGVFISKGGQVLDNHYENYCQPMLTKLGDFASNINRSVIDDNIIVNESYHQH